MRIDFLLVGAVIEKHSTEVGVVKFCYALHSSCPGITLSWSYKAVELKISPWSFSLSLDRYSSMWLIFDPKANKRIVEM